MFFSGRQRRRITRESGRWRHCGRYSRSTTRSQGKGEGEVKLVVVTVVKVVRMIKVVSADKVVIVSAQEIEMMEKDDYQAYLQNGESRAVICDAMLTDSSCCCFE